jgi:hypothetical protein
MSDLPNRVIDRGRNAGRGSKCISSKCPSKCFSFLSPVYPAQERLYAAGQYGPGTQIQGLDSLDSESGTGELGCMTLVLSSGQRKAGWFWLEMRMTLSTGEPDQNGSYLVGSESPTIRSMEPRLNKRLL